MYELVDLFGAFVVGMAFIGTIVCQMLEFGRLAIFCLFIGGVTNAKIFIG